MEGSGAVAVYRARADRRLIPGKAKADGRSDANSARGNDQAGHRAAPERAACSSPACGLHCYNTSEHSEHHNRNQPVIFEQTGDIAGNVSVPD